VSRFYGPQCSTTENIPVPVDIIVSISLCWSVWICSSLFVENHKFESYPA